MINIKYTGSGPRTREIDRGDEKLAGYQRTPPVKAPPLSYGDFRTGDRMGEVEIKAITFCKLLQQRVG